MKKQFPLKRIKPVKGIINAVIFENSFISLPQTLFFSIEIELKPFDMSKLSPFNKDKNYQTSFQLGWIKLDITHLKQLENKIFTFPINPEAGYIDSSIYMFDAHNIVDTTHITFGTFNNQSIPVKITLRIDFEFEGTDYATTNYFDFETELELDEVSIANDILNADEKNLKKAKFLVQQFIHSENFEEPYLSVYGIALKMKA